MTEPETVSVVLGAGGGATARFIEREIVPRFSNPSLSPLEDGAYAPFEGSRLVATMDTHAVDPPVFPGGDIGRLTVSGTVNDLVASGARPMYMTLGLTLVAGVPMQTVRTVLDSVASTAREAGIIVIAGDTKVIDGGREGLLLHAAGIGSPVCKHREFGLADARPGNVVIVTGTVGDHEIAVLSQREGLGFEQRVRSDCAPLGNLILPLLAEFGEIRALRDPTRGGLLGALFDLAEKAGVDVTASRDAVPVAPHVAAASQMLGLDPLEMVNEGKMLVVVEAAAAEAVLARLRAHRLGSEAAIIAELGNAVGPGKVRMQESGGTRIASRPEGSRLPRLC